MVASEYHVKAWCFPLSQYTGGYCIEPGKVFGHLPQSAHSESGERLLETMSGFYPLSLDAPPPTLLKKAVPEAPRASIWVPNQQNMGP